MLIQTTQHYPDSLECLAHKDACQGDVVEQKIILDSLFFQNDHFGLENFGICVMAVLGGYRHLRLPPEGVPRSSVEVSCWRVRINSKTHVLTSRTFWIVVYS